jgi:hypothetical protein
MNEINSKDNSKEKNSVKGNSLKENQSEGKLEKESSFKESKIDEKSEKESSPKELLIDGKSLKLQECGQDGNCLFRSLLASCGLNEDDHSKLRKRICDDIIDSSEEYKKRIEESLDTKSSLDEYISKMICDNTYGTFTELAVFTKNSGLGVVIVEYLRINPQNIHSIKNLSDQKDKLIYLKYIKGQTYECNSNHYDALIDINNIDEIQKIMLEYLSKNENKEKTTENKPLKEINTSFNENHEILNNSQITNLNVSSVNKSKSEDESSLKESSGITNLKMSIMKNSEEKDKNDIINLISTDESKIKKNDLGKQKINHFNDEKANDNKKKLEDNHIKFVKIPQNNQNSKSNFSKNELNINSKHIFDQKEDEVNDNRFRYFGERSSNNQRNINTSMAKMYKIHISPPTSEKEFWDYNDFLKTVNQYDINMQVTSIEIPYSTEKYAFNNLPFVSSLLFVTITKI